MNETEKPTHSLIFELSHEDLNFKLLRSNDGLETLLGKLVVRYQIFSDQNICRFMLLHEDELLNQGQVDVEESLVDEINGHAPQERPSGNSKIGLIGLVFKLFKSAKTIKVVLAAPRWLATALFLAGSSPWH